MKLHSQEMNAKKTGFYKMDDFVESLDETAVKIHVRTRQDSVPWSSFKGLLSAGILGGVTLLEGVSRGDGL